MVVDSALVFTYTRPAVGREKEAFAVFQDAATFFGKLAADGRCLEPEFFVGPFAKGILVVKGSHDDLLEIAQSEDFIKFYLRAGYAVKDIGYELFYFGERVTEIMGLWATVGQELGYM